MKKNINVSQKDYEYALANRMLISNIKHNQGDVLQLRSPTGMTFPFKVIGVDVCMNIYVLD